MPIARFQMPDGRIGRFEVPDGTLPADAEKMISASLTGNQPTTGSSTIQQTAPEKPWYEKALGYKPLQDFAAGASSTYRGAANLISTGLGEKIWPTQNASPSDPGLNWRTAGELADPAAWAVAGGAGKVIPYAKVLGQGLTKGTQAVAQNAAQGALGGAGIGALSDQGTAAGGAEAGAGLGALLPTAISSVMGPARWTGRALTSIVNPTPAAGRAVYDVAGEGSKWAQPKVQSIVDALQNATPGQTAAQATAPLKNAEFAGLTKIAEGAAPSKFSTSMTKSGDIVGEIPQAQQTARDNLLTNLQASTGIQREQQLDIVNQANKGQGIDNFPLLQNIDAMLDNKKISSNLFAKKYLNDTRQRIIENSKNGFIDADSTYAVRKDAGKLLQKASEDTATWDKGAAASVEKNIQLSIDNEFEKAGATGWKDYLQTFSKGKSEIKSELANDELVKALQKTGASSAKVAYGGELASSLIPHILYRPAVIASQLISHLQGAGRQGTTNELSRLMEPENLGEFAKVIQNQAPHDPLVNALMRRLGIVYAGQQQ